MSMADAIRATREKLPEWMGGAPNAAIEPPVIKTALECMVDIVRASNYQYQGMMDKQSSTWLAVSAWASRELLEALAELETADGKQVIATQARIRAMRDVLEMESVPKQVRMESSAPFIP